MSHNGILFLILYLKFSAEYKIRNKNTNRTKQQIVRGKLLFQNGTKRKDRTKNVLLQNATVELPETIKSISTYYKRVPNHKESRVPSVTIRVWLPLTY